ncbi:unnamed protein product, partial [marine sediment metagenome]
GKKDHSTVMHACRKIGKEREQNDEFRRFLERLAYSIKNQGS